MSDLFDLSGRVALVTGGSRGLGREIVLGYARAGADVVIASRKIESCEAVAEEVAALGGQALPVACHVGRWDELDALTDAAYERFGKVDILVNNAGMSPLYPSLGEVSEDLFDKVVGVNLKGPFRLSARIGERMVADGGGCIINISSNASARPHPSFLVYAAAKSALETVTVGFARALGPTVRVNAIMPGTFLTDISHAWDMDAFERGAQAFPLQRGGRPDEIVGTALYLAGDASSYTTGTVIAVDGGAMWAMPDGTGES
jgi:NAD(P)-dependent dehydrogenase (short-subunit alcohol dehydrogenase family)